MTTDLTSKTIETAKIQALASIVDTEEEITPDMYDKFIDPEDFSLDFPIWEPLSDKTDNELIKQCRYEFNKFIGFAKVVAANETKHITAPIKKLVEAINANIENVPEEYFSENMQGVATVIRLQFISEELEYISSAIKSKFEMKEPKQISIPKTVLEVANEYKSSFDEMTHMFNSGRSECANEIAQCISNDTGILVNWIMDASNGNFKKGKSNA